MTEPTNQEQPVAPDPGARGPLTTAPAGSPAAPRWDAPPPAPTSRRSGLANAAGIVLIVLGVLVGIAGAALLAFSGMANDVVGAGGAALPEGVPWTGAIGQALTIIAVILLVLAVGYVLSGVGVLRGRSAGRVGGIVLGVIGTLLTLPGALDMSGASGSGGGLFNLLFVAAHIFVMVALATRWHPAGPPPRQSYPA